MARRMYDLDNGTEDIKVKKIETNSIVGADNQINFYAANSINFETQYGEFYLSDDGFIITAPTITFDTNIIDFLQTQLVLAWYSTIERPSPIKEGAIIYDITLKKCILWNGTAWVNLDGTALS